MGLAVIHRMGRRDNTLGTTPERAAGALLHRTGTAEMEANLPTRVTSLALRSVIPSPLKAPRQSLLPG